MTGGTAVSHHHTQQQTALRPPGLRKAWPTAPHAAQPELSWRHGPVSSTGEGRRCRNREKGGFSRADIRQLEHMTPGQADLEQKLNTTRPTA
jgi:hypothetical protein